MAVVTYVYKRRYSRPIMLETQAEESGTRNGYQKTETYQKLEQVSYVKKNLIQVHASFR